LTLYSSDVSILELRKWVVVCQQAVKVLVAARVMETRSPRLVWKLDSVGRREQDEHSLIMLFLSTIYHPYLAEFSLMERAGVLASLRSRAARVLIRMP